MNRQELHKWLEQQNPELKRDTPMSSVYYLVTYIDDTYEEEITEPLYLGHINNTYFESPCTLTSIELKEEDLKNYVHITWMDYAFEDALLYVQNMFKDNALYEIHNFQCGPFIKEVKNITMISERECLEWLLSHDRKENCENVKKLF